MDNFGFSVIIKEAHVMIRSVEDMKKNNVTVPTASPKIIPANTSLGK
mgnify:CR=1 FL=1